MAGVVNLDDLDPGGDVGVGPVAPRPQPGDAPGNRSGGWVKAGTAAEGQWPYVDDGHDGPAPWKQT